MQDRTMIRNIKLGKNRIAGWLIKKDKHLVLKDYSSEVNLKEEMNKFDFQKYHFIECEGVFDGYEFLITNIFSYSISCKPTVESVDSNYSLKPYAYYLSDEIRSFQFEKMNLQNIVRSFFLENDFLEVDYPSLFCSVNEYGENEWEASNNINSLKYSLLQSSEMPSLLCCAGGLERTFSFSKCFRISPVMNENSLIEFTQLIFSICFCNLQEGRKFTNDLIDYFMSVLNNSKYEINEIDYKEAKLLYGDDKPNFQFKNIFYPILKDPNKKCQVWNNQMGEKDIGIIKNQFNNRNISFSILTNYSDLKNEILDSGFLNYLSGPFTAIILDKDFSHLFQSLAKSFYSKYYSTNCNFNFVWVKNYLFNENLRFNNNMDENNYCIFSDIDENGLDEIINNEEFTQEYSTNTNDLVLNGIEIATCGTRVQSVQHFLKMCKVHEIENPETKFDYYLDALENGVPEHFVIGIGWERLLYILFKMREMDYVQLFPKKFIS